MCVGIIEGRRPISLTYMELLCKAKGYDLDTVLRYSYKYRTLDDPQSLIQYELMKADLAFRQATSEVTEALNKMAEGLTEAINKMAQAAHDMVNSEPFLSAVQTLQEAFEAYNRVYEIKIPYQKHPKPRILSVQQYMRRQNVDQRGVIRRNVRDHRY